MKRRVLLALLLAGCATTSTQKQVVSPDTVYLKPDGWVISYSPGLPTHPSALAGAAWMVELPGSDGLHYVMVPYRQTILHKAVKVTFKVETISGTPKFVSVDKGCGGEPSFQIMLEKAGDNMTANQEFYRWWSNPEFSIPTDGQVHTVTIPLTPDRWSSVFGKVGTAVPGEWKDAMLHLMAAGFTFGGGCTAGHGLLVVNGKARFVLIDLKIE